MTGTAALICEGLQNERLPQGSWDMPSPDRPALQVWAYQSSTLGLGILSDIPESAGLQTIKYTRCRLPGSAEACVPLVSALPLTLGDRSTELLSWKKRLQF